MDGSLTPARQTTDPLRIASVGLLTAQGTAQGLLEHGGLLPPRLLDWSPSMWTTSHLAYQAPCVDPCCTGFKRWNALARGALRECLEGNNLPGALPLIVGTCNGGAASFQQETWRQSFDTSELLKDTAWENKSVPVVSGSCASGLQALFLARQILAGGAKHVLVLAVDILSQPNHENFEVLRVLSENVEFPWQLNGNGFILGEAAVAVLLSAGGPDDDGAFITGPVLGNDLKEFDGLQTALSPLFPGDVQLIMGQGTGPYSVNERELRSLRSAVPLGVPLSTAIFHFGHTLGASGLLSLALAALMIKTRSVIPGISMPARFALDGRPLADGQMHDDNILIACRALNGMCASAAISRRHRPYKPGERAWVPIDKGELPSHPTLHAIANTASHYRPGSPPDLLLVNLETPLCPTPMSFRSGRLMPSSVVEITPAFLPHLIARRWGFGGPSMCLLGSFASTGEVVQEFRRQRATVSLVRVLGDGYERKVEWSTS